MPMHQAAGLGEAPDGLHDGREARDGAGAQVVAIGEAAGHQDCVAAFEVMGLVPQVGHRLAHYAADDVVGIVVAVGAGEDQNAEFHSFRLAFGGIMRVAPGSGEGQRKKEGKSNTEILTLRVRMTTCGGLGQPGERLVVEAHRHAHHALVDTGIHGVPCPALETWR